MIKLNQKDVEVFGNIEEGFVEPALSAAIDALASEVDGWEDYGIVKTDSTHGEELTVYTLDLEKDSELIATAYITIRGAGVNEVEIEVE